MLLVLILVIAVDGLGELKRDYRKELLRAVLILVIAVDGLGELYNNVYSEKKSGLNPCYSGRWSRSPSAYVLSDRGKRVLILVIAVDGLGVCRFTCYRRMVCWVLILVIAVDGLGGRYITIGDANDAGS